MKAYQEILRIATGAREAMYDITSRVRAVLAKSGVNTGTVLVYVQGATAAVMIQENWDESVQHDIIRLLGTLIPRGAWEHDRQDGNGDAHLKAGLVGPGESIPVIAGGLGLSRWQNVFLCEFDGPREARTVVVTVTGE